MTTFILWSSNSEWQEKKSINCGVTFFFSIGETFHIHIFVAVLEAENKKGHSISLHRSWKKIKTKVTSRWLEGWVSQTHQVEDNDNKILDAFSYQKTKSNTSGGPKKFWLCKCCVLLNLKHSPIIPLP